jgi:hypothetical protein
MIVYNPARSAQKTRALLTEKENSALVPILKLWPTQFDNTQAISLGFKRPSL